jgi:phage terminase Nu1 subunit (DNA packaging protein)
MAKAEMSEMERDKMRGSLVDAEQVRLFAADLGATFRAALEILPDRVASELVVLNDVESVRSVLVEAFEQLLLDLSLKIEAGLKA